MNVLLGVLLIPLAASQLVGQLHYISTDNDKVQEMAMFAMNKLSGLKEFHGNTNGFTVLSAATQTVSGVNYHLSINFGKQTCNVTLWHREWLHDTHMTNHFCWNVHKRQLMMAGGAMSVDVNRKDVQEMVNYALAQMNLMTGEQNTVMKVISAKTQVVAGVNYILDVMFANGDQHKECNIIVWEQSWLGKRTITEHKCHTVAKRQLLGQITNMDTKSTKVTQLASFAMTEINKLEADQNTLVTTLMAMQQHVNGWKYYLMLNVQTGSRTRVCNATIYDSGFSGTHMTMTEHNCEDLKHHHKNRQLGLGGVMPGRLTPEVQKAVLFAEDELNKKSNNLYRMVTQKVDHITQQVVAGVKYNFHVHLVTSTCMNTADNYGSSLDKCAASKTAQHMTCKLSVLDQAWMTPEYTLLEDHCGKMS